MNDLVLLRELIRSPANSGAQRDINHVLLQVDFERMFECVITRAAPRCSPIAVALSLNILRVKSINACKRSASSVRKFGNWYAKRLNTLIHMDVAPTRFKTFRLAMDPVYILASETSNALQPPDRQPDMDRLTRPLSIINDHIQLRSSKSPGGTGSASSPNPYRGKRSAPSPPRVTRTLDVDTHVSTSVGQRLSEHTLGELQKLPQRMRNRLSHVRN